VNELSFLDSIKGKKILVAPLDWGLGHATRSSRIIDKLKDSNEVQIASSGLALAWLEKRYPTLTNHQIPSYNIRYHYSAMWLNMLLSLPQLAKTIRKERQIVNHLVAKHQFDLIIADHRLGTVSQHCRSVVMAHQIHIPHYNPLIASFASFLNRRFLNRYDEVWIPDYSDPKKSLSGNLSKIQHLKNPRFIGPLSMMESKLDPTEKDIDIAILLSGPEPSRSKVEMQLVNAVKDYPDSRIALIRGSNLPIPEHILKSKVFKTVINLADHQEIEGVLQRSRKIVCRSGYSTIMDLESLGRKAILIPTKNQPEQEYLAKYHSNRGYLSLSESEFKNKKLLLQLLDSKEINNKEVP